MRGIKRGVAACILEAQPPTLFVHCIVHSRDPSLQDAIRGTSLMRDSVTLVNNLGVLVKDSPKREAAFAQLAQEMAVPDPVPSPRPRVRWRAVRTVLSSYCTSLMFLEDIEEYRSSARTCTGERASG